MRLGTGVNAPLSSKSSSIPERNQQSSDREKRDKMGPNELQDPDSLHDPEDSFGTAENRTQRETWTCILRTNRCWTDLLVWYYVSPSVAIEGVFGS